MEPATQNQQLDLRTGRVWLDDDGIVHADIKAHAELGLDDAHEWMRQIGIASTGKPRPVLVDYGRLKSISRDARRYFASPAVEPAPTATALVITSPIGRAIGNFFMGLNKPDTPTKLFTDQATATDWLRSFV